MAAVVQPSHRLLAQVAALFVRHRRIEAGLLHQRLCAGIDADGGNTSGNAQWLERLDGGEHEPE
jgi:hypothetical protein